MTARGYGTGGYGYSGYGYGMGAMTEPRVLPDYYGPNAHDIEGAFAANEARQRQAGIDKQNAEERDLRMTGERARQQREQANDPIEHALEMARLRQMGVKGPGEPDDTQGGMPAARPPVSPGLVGTARDPNQPVNPGLVGTARDPNMGRSNVPSGYQGAAPTGTAHDLPGAFNAATGQHNPADIDLGGGYRLSGAMTPEGRQSRARDELLHSGIPGMTPELAMYLSEHPEHISTMVDAQFRKGGSAEGPSAYGGRTRQQWMEDEKYLHGLSPANEKAENLSPEQALQFVNDTYAPKNSVTGERESALTPAARLRMARDISHGRINPDQLQSHRAPPGVTRGPQGPDTSKRHISKDQQAYLQHIGKFDPDRYTVDEE
ncbi:MAG TPA: hypothetical protein VEU74_12150 [Gemmatimonadales bacterium]|nr:hypothetical protein [Gemmatimonadales bacterium]